MSLSQQEALIIDYESLIEPRIDEHGVVAVGLAVDELSNVYYSWSSVHKFGLPELVPLESGELVLNEDQVNGVFQSLHWSCKARTDQAQREFKDAYSLRRGLAPWTRAKRLERSAQAIERAEWITKQAERPQALMMALGSALVDSARLRTAAKQ